MKKISLLILITLLFSNMFSQNIKFDNEYAIWPEKAPKTEVKDLPWETYAEEWTDNDGAVNGVVQPTIRVFHPKKKKTDMAIIICPGGGYNMEVIGREGYKVAEKLNEYGITAIVLKYRHYSKEAAVQDSKRAVQFVKSKAKEWGIDSSKVGIGGFSAGGHLAANTGSKYDPFKDIEKDDISKISHIPSFLLLMYPAFKYGLLKDADNTYPPNFIVVAGDDLITPADDCMHYYHKFLTLKIPSELHIFQKGGHGFDIGNDTCNCHLWVDLFIKWLETNKLF